MEVKGHDARASGPCPSAAVIYEKFPDTGMQPNFPVYSRKFRDGW